MEARSDVLGAGDGTFRPARSARLLNPRTPARPDLKSGAVVLAWLPPRGAHRAVGIMPFLRKKSSALIRSHAGGNHRAEDLLRGERVGASWVASMAAWPSSREAAGASATHRSSSSRKRARASASSTTAKVRRGIDG